MQHLPLNAMLGYANLCYQSTDYLPVSDYPQLVDIMQGHSKTASTASPAPIKMKLHPPPTTTMRSITQPIAATTPIHRDRVRRESAIKAMARIAQTRSNVRTYNAVDGEYFQAVHSDDDDDDDVDDDDDDDENDTEDIDDDDENDVDHKSDDNDENDDDEEEENDDDEEKEEEESLVVLSATRRSSRVEQPKKVSVASQEIMSRRKAAASAGSLLALPSDDDEDDDEDEGDGRCKGNRSVRSLLIFIIHLSYMMIYTTIYI